jgi:activator of HSP90 ATPase
MSNTISQSYEIKATPAQVFEALTNPEVIQQWSGAPAKIDAQEGSEFSLFGDNIVGKNLQVVPNQKLVQDWAEKSWDVSSKVTFTLKGNNGGTTLDILHEGVPDAAVESITGGWKDYFMGPIQKMFVS